MEVLSNTPITLRKIFNGATMLDLSIDDVNDIELQLLPEKLGGSDNEYYEVIRTFFNRHPYFTGLGSKHYDLRLLTDVKREMLPKYLKWIIDSITSWNGNNANSKFSALCQLIRVFNWGDDFWNLLKSSGFQNDRWLNVCCQVLQATTYEVRSVRFPQNPILFDNENKSFTSSEKEQDWEGVAEFLRTIERHSNPPILKESFRCLYTLDFHRLMDVCNNLDTVLVALACSQCLSRSEALYVAETTTSPYVRFVFVYSNIRTGIADHEENVLFNIFHAVAQNESEWRKWLKVFNQYPVRFPHLQKILGAVLAKSSRSAIQAYFGSLQLHIQPSEERGLVSECLSVFRSLAPESKRIYAWRVAYRRWLNWNFDALNEKSLMEVSQSAIDFAIVGFFVEVEQEHTQNATDNLVERLNIILDDWHESAVSLATKQNRTFSFFQPLIHAKAVIERSVDWYYPSELRYKLDFGDKWRRYRELMELGSSSNG